MNAGTLRSATGHRGVRIGVAVAVIAVVGWRLGASPFVEGVRAADPAAVLVAVVVTACTTWCCALRWSLVSARRGESLPLPVAYAAYYRSQLVNATLPGGVVGDLHRGVRHGWRSVLWERATGQAVQLAFIAALLLPGAWRWVGVTAVVALVAVGGMIALLSVLSTTGHLLVFLVAASSAGAALPTTSAISVGALVLLGASIPLNVAGWGPREGVAAWAFAAFGSTAETGLAVAVTFGVMATVATLPGLAFVRRRRA